MSYGIDTSALLDGWVRYYPPDVFPGLWKQLERLIASGRMSASEEVLYELEKKHDEVFEWARNNSRLFVPIDLRTQEAVKEIMGKFPRLVNTQKNRSSADPFVIALAKVRSLTVVTGEARSGRADRPMIPDVCDAHGLRCLTLTQLLREERWTF